MKPIQCSCRIASSVEDVFHTISSPENYSQAVPHILKLEFLSEQRSGVGTRVRETRKMGSKEAVAEFEVTGFTENERLQIVSDAGGAIWDSAFTVTPQEDETLLSIHMDIRPQTLLARIFIPLIRSQVTKGIEEDLQCVKRHCEASSS